MKRVIICLMLFLSLIIAQEGARYLIICADELESSIQPLAQWKNKKGMMSKICSKQYLEDRHYAWTADGIKDFIRNAYNTWSPQLEYILLVGSPGLLPPYTWYSDGRYADMVGAYDEELSIGRFWARTPAECDIIVAKTLNYEKNPPNGNWFLKGTTIVREDDPQDRYYQEDAQYIRELWENADYIQRDFFLGGEQGNNNYVDVINAINDGRTFVVFRGQSVNFWWDPFTFDPDDTDNGFKLPVVISGSCQTVELSEAEMLGDQFLRAGTVTNPKGAVGYFGTTLADFHLSEHRSVVTKGFFNAIFELGVYKMGDAAKWAKYEHYDYFNGGFEYRYWEWNLLGDPELPLWTAEPSQLVVSWSLTGVPPNFLTVTVKDQSQMPVTEALVCIMTDDNTFYEYGYTDNNGNITFPFIEGNPMSLTVTARNYLPYEEEQICILSSSHFNKMTANNNTYRIASSRSGRLHLVYTGGTTAFPKVYYTYSDDGIIWSTPQCIGNGEYPTLVLYPDGSNDIPCIVWCTKERYYDQMNEIYEDINRYYYTYIGSVDPPLMVNTGVHYWGQYPPPDIKVSPPSICLKNDHIFLSYECGPWPQVQYQNNVCLWSFDVYSPTWADTPEFIFQADTIHSNTSIACDNYGIISIAFREGFDYHRLKVAYNENNQWYIQYIEDGVSEPSLSSLNYTLALIYRSENDIYWRYGLKGENSYFWSDPKNISRGYTSNPSSPIAADLIWDVWTSNGEIFYSYNGGIPVNISNTPIHTSDYPQACILKKGLSRWLYTVWVDGDNPYWIRSTKVKFPYWCVPNDGATGPNNGELLTLDHTNGNFHLVFNTGTSVAYSKSTDKGETWEDVVELDSGVNPSVALDTFGLPRITYLKNDTVFCQILKPDSSWDTVVIFGYDQSQKPKEPALAPSFPPELANYSYSTFSTEDPFSANSKINFSIFDVTEDIAPSPNEVATGDSLKSPSIAITPGDYVHIVWEQKGEIYYRTSLQPLDPEEEIVWSDIFNVSGSPMVFSEHPVVEAYGENIIVAWKEGNPGEIYRRTRNINSDIADWLEIENISQSPAQESDYPALSTPDVVAWQEQVDTLNYEIFLWIQGDIVNLSVTENSSKFPHVVVEPQELYGDSIMSPDIVIDAMWTEQIIPEALYEVKFKRYQHSPDSFARTAYISVSVGDSLPSPYCEQRNGFVQYGSYSLDYSRTSLIYNLPYLKPMSSYLIEAIALHGERGRWYERILIDTMLSADIYFEPNIPKQVNLIVPKVSYNNDLAIRKNVAKILGRFALVADLKVYEVNHPNASSRGGIQNLICDDLKRFILYQNRPNPFKDLTKISFTIPRESKVSLFIYDIQGRRVRTLIDGKLQPGDYNYTWDGKDNRNRRLTQGVYFYRLQTEDFKDTKKTVLLK